MTRARTLAGSALPVLLVLGFMVIAPGRASALAGSDDDPGAIAALRRAVVASVWVSYDGTQIVATWTPMGETTRVLDVRQSAGGPRWVSVRGAGAEASTSSERPAPDVDGGGIDTLQLLAGAYQVVLGGQGAVAGRPATLVLARRAGRVAARLWVDRSSGLMLRQEVLDPSGRLTRMSTFVEIRHVVLTQDPAAATQESGSGATARSATLQLGAVRSGRLTLTTDCPTTLPGGFRLVDTRLSPSASDGKTEHLTYSDGLSAVSVFLQPGRLSTDGREDLQEQTWDGVTVYVAVGWPTRVVWEGEGNVLTAVSDAPLDEVRSAVTAMPHGPGYDASLLARLSRSVHAAMGMLSGG